MIANKQLVQTGLGGNSKGEKSATHISLAALVKMGKVTGLSHPLMLLLDAIAGVEYPSVE